jgi:uncharacterized RDD family membrane protein YckC
LSTQPTFKPQWKEEVNRRIAAHKSRRGQPTADDGKQQASQATTRAAEAAARVAARYSKAPSYSQMQAEEARIAVRHAEIATKVALAAQAVAETALAEMHAAAQQEPRGPAVVQPISAARSSAVVQAPASGVQPSSLSAERPGTAETSPAQLQDEAAVAPAGEQEAEPRRVLGIRWDPDLPKYPADRKPEPRRAREEFALSVEDWWSPAELAETLRSNPIEVTETDSSFATLIEFPRELVATRKLRPGWSSTEADGQLSIFEVDPSAISTAPQGPELDKGATSTRGGPEWSGMRLDSQPVQGPGAGQMGSASASLPVASLGLRLMAAVVDCALILACFVSIGFLFAHSVQHPPTGKGAELLGLAGLALIGIAYYACFFALPVSTPGMMYAGVGLCTFDDQSPTRGQLRRRLVAMLLSILPVGLGLVWSLFDEDHLSWHDRYSQTYPRKL